jgi:hypothetical protein
LIVDATKIAECRQFAVAGLLSKTYTPKKYEAGERCPFRR